MTPAQLVLIRGLPGSGKSTLAKAIQTKYPDYSHYEADQYFMVGGRYVFDPEKIGDAHNRCEECTFRALEAHHDVVVSNTFTRYREIEPYLVAARPYNVSTYIVECHGVYSNVHNCPMSTIERMRSRWLSQEQLADIVLCHWFDQSVMLWDDESFRRLCLL